MQKVYSILIAAIYLLLSTGIVINLHYCQGKLESVSLVTESTKCCCAGEMPVSNCCNNKELIVQLDVHEQLAQQIHIHFELFDYIEIEQPGMEEYVPNVAQKIIYIDYDLPPPKQPIWKTNCAFLFYG